MTRPHVLWREQRGWYGTGRSAGLESSIIRTWPHLSVANLSRFANMHGRIGAMQLRKDKHCPHQTSTQSQRRRYCDSQDTEVAERRWHCVKLDMTAVDV